MEDAEKMFEKDPGLLSDIVSAMPKRVESTLNGYKTKILGTLPKSRDDFDPSSLLSKLEKGHKVVWILQQGPPS